MPDQIAEFDGMQSAYKAAVEEWISAIRREEALASVNHTIAQVDQWEAAHFKEEELRNKAKAAKKQYEDALRRKFFNFLDSNKTAELPDAPSASNAMVRQ